MIYITGDTHGNWMSRLNANSFPEQKEMTKDDYVIVLGDFGIWDNSKTENYNLDWLDNKPFTTLFISGNHSNYDILDSLSIEKWHGGNVNFIRPSIIHLMRGEVFNIENRKFFTFGGASSHDIRDGILEIGDERIKQWNKDYSKIFRVNHLSWWKRELPNQEEMNNGIKNLELNNNKVDYILTHCPYTSLLKQMDGGSGLYESDVLTDYLQKIKQTVDYKQWLFGHMHINQNYYWERATCLYEQITRIL
jgi:predicted phosphodiesterase